MAKSLNQQMYLIAQPAVGGTQATKMKPISRTVAAYLAGLLDGEGSISAYRGGYQKHKHSLKIDVTNTDLAVLVWAQTRTGVGVVKIDDRRGRSRQTKPCYHWIVSTNQAGDLLQRLLPYLHIKRGRAEAAILLQRSMRRYFGPGRTTRLSVEQLKERQNLANLLVVNPKYLS